MKATKLLTARSTVIALFTAIGAALLLASALPQRASIEAKAPAWVERLPAGLHFLSSLLGLDNIVGSVWFAVLVGVFWCSLLLSCVSQFSAARALSRRVPQAAPPREGTRVELDEASFARALQAAGYRLEGGADGVKRYVKNRIGYWGNFLLHVGLVTAVLFSLVYVLTQHRVLVRVVGNELTGLTPDNVQESLGALPLERSLPGIVVLKSLVPRFWANDKLESLSSELFFAGQPGDEPRRVAVALSDKSHFGPYIVYQTNEFGRVFDLEFASAKGELHRERLFLRYPMRRDVAGYGELSLAGTDLLLKGKFYADGERKGMQLRLPPLTLRLYRGKELQAEATLAPGSREQLGPFAVRVVHSEWWTDILLDGTRGTAGIFTGFALILAGVLSAYCLVPREIMVWSTLEGLLAQQVVRRFAELYREEFEDIIQSAGKTGGS